MKQRASSKNDLTITISRFAVKETVDRMISTIAALDWHLFARIDHAAQARNKGLALRPTELILFGNPEIGTLLMHDCQLAAIDLPMKVLTWEDEAGQTRVAYNSLSWLKQRHGLTDEATLEAIGEVLTRVCASVQTPRDVG